MSHSEKEVEEEVIDYLVDFQHEIEENLNKISILIKKNEIKSCTEEIDKILLKIKQRVDYSIENWDFEFRK